MLLNVDNLSVSYGTQTVVNNVSFSLSEGDWLMLIGPNGAGKSSIIHALSRSVPYSGTVSYLDKDIASYKSVELAKKIGVLSQTNYVEYSFSVAEIVRLGRYAYAPHIFSSSSDEDDLFVAEALRMTGMEELADKPVTTLSGGELQRVFLAQLFAQNPSVLLLDEPTNHLDLIYQKQTFELIKNWLKAPGRAAVSVVHDLSLARTYGTCALLLDRSECISYGPTETVFTPSNLNSVYNMDVSEWMRMLLSKWT